MPWIWSAFMPHPPVLIPAVGRGREREAAATSAGLSKLIEIIKLSYDEAPDAIFLLSPHQPTAQGALFLNGAAKASGSLSRFGAGEVAFELNTPVAFLKRFSAFLESAGVPVATRAFPDLTPDHSAMVPLYFLREAFEALPPVLLGNPIGLGFEGALAAGRAAAKFETSLKLALVASGDLSHRLAPAAPAGYSPHGATFDKAVVSAFERGDPESLLALPPECVTAAGECGLRSALFMLGLTGGPARVLSYEGPFGVGYAVAFHSPDGNSEGAKKPAVRGVEEAKPCCAVPPAEVAGSPLPRLARMIIERLLSGRDAAFTEEEVRGLALPDGIWTEPAACFVSIKTKGGALRGCIGTILPTRESLGREIMGNAVAASTRDPRFPPMKAEELAGVDISVDVLSAPESVSGPADLDPKVWGVIVSKGGRRGLLLPDLEGVNTVEQQLDIAARKGGITDLEGAALERFSVVRHRE